MMITIASFTVGTSYDYPAMSVRHERDHLPITYWGIYLDDKYISYTSNKELAEKTKIWMEKWLKGQNLK
jgi:hypothetical protein